MDIKKLKLHNFWSYRDTEISFDKDFYMILGKIEGESKSNGSGKSSIARAICYALYGDQSSEIKNDSAIYNDEDKMFVELLFELNGEEIFIKRSVKRGNSPVLRITKNGEVFNSGLKAGQELINNILGADFSIYKNTSYFRQGDLNSFSSLTPKEAKEVLMNILQLDNYNKYEELAKTMIKKVDENISTLNIHINNHIANIKDMELNFHTTIRTKEELDVYKEKLELLNHDKATMTFLINSQNKSLEEIRSKQREIDNDKMKVAARLDEVNNRIHKLEGLSTEEYCPTCEHALNKTEVITILEIIEKEREVIIKQHDEFIRKLNKLENDKEEINSVDIPLDDQEVRILEVTKNIVQIETELNIVKKDENKLAKLKAELTNYFQTKEHKEILRESYEKLQIAFGKKGIQAHIIDSIIPEIQITTNDILEGLETKIRLSIDSQKELKKGGKAETLDINILTEFGERPYTNYSGGEKTFIDFALRIALSVILSRRSNCQIQTLILDEVFGELDMENKRIISRALTYVANKFNFKKILIISHAEELQDSFNNVIQVVFDGEKSYIEQEKVNEKSIQYV